LPEQQKVPLNDRALAIDLRMDVAPTRKQETSIALNLSTSDSVIIVNTLPLLSAIQTLLEASSVPFQTVKNLADNEEDGKSVDVIPASPRTLDIALSDSIDDVDGTQEPENSFFATLSASVDIEVTQISFLFLVNGASTCRDVLHFDAKKLEIKLESTGMNGKLTILAEPFELSPGQMINGTSKHSLDWTLLPYKPIITVQGVKLLTSITERRSPSETTYEIDVKQGVEFVFVSVSPLTLVALAGVLKSFKLAEDNDYEEQFKALKETELNNYRSRVALQREELESIFNSIDADHSGTLEDFELEQLVRMMCEKSSGVGLPTINSASGLTTAELNREKMFLISLLDSKGMNEVTLLDVEKTLYQLATGIDDSHLEPKIGTTGVEHLDELGSKSNSFLSGLFLRKLVQFDDLREFTAMHHVFRITGFDDIDKKSAFPAPTTWHVDGIEMFWEQYTSETGCTRSSLNGQDAKMVQQKLVRSLW
jgi:hypothetical protein